MENNEFLRLLFRKTELMCIFSVEIVTFEYGGTNSIIKMIFKFNILLLPLQFNEAKN